MRNITKAINYGRNNHVLGTRDHVHGIYVHAEYSVLYINHGMFFEVTFEKKELNSY